MHRFAQSVFYPAATCIEKVEFRRDPAGTAAMFQSGSTQHLGMFTLFKWSAEC